MVHQYQNRKNHHKWHNSPQKSSQVDRPRIGLGTEASWATTSSSPRKNNHWVHLNIDKCGQTRYFGAHHRHDHLSPLASLNSHFQNKEKNVYISWWKAPQGYNQRSRCRQGLHRLFQEELQELDTRGSPPVIIFRILYFIFHFELNTRHKVTTCNYLDDFTFHFELNTRHLQLFCTPNGKSQRLHQLSTIIKILGAIWRSSLINIGLDKTHLNVENLGHVFFLIFYFSLSSLFGGGIINNRNALVGFILNRDIVGGEVGTGRCYLRGRHPEKSTYFYYWEIYCFWEIPLLLLLMRNPLHNK